MLSIAEIIDQIKKLKKVSTDSEVAGLLEMKPQTLATSKMRGSIPYEALISFCDKEKCSLDLLLKGSGGRAEGTLKVKEQPEEVERGFIMVPLVEAEAAAGITGTIPDDSIKDCYPFKKSWIRRIAGGLGKERTGKLVLIRARGQSMQPTVSDGELILVNLRDRYEIKNDAIYIVRAPDGGILVKRLIQVAGGILCLSDNKSFATFQINLKPGDSVANYVLGRVCWIGRELV